MSIIQISKIQQRYGELVDLPQLDQAEFGFAADVNRLFIGKTTGNTENIEVLTSYSDISFSQIDGSAGSNLNINGSTLANGQVLVYDGSSWVNRGGDVGGYINLGDVSNVSIEGGGIGYVLTTDGVGNLSWTPKGVIVANIADITQSNPGIITCSENIFLTNGSSVTVTGVTGMTQVNGNSFYIGNLTNNSFSLYSDITLTNTVNTESYSTYVSGGIITSSVGGSEGAANAAGGNTEIQFNYNNLLYADGNLTYDFINSLFVLNGTANISTNVNVGGNILVNYLAANANVNSSNVNTGNLAVTGTSNLNVLGNVTILGGLPGQVISTDGAGNLSWANITEEPIGYFLYSQPVASAVWTIEHNLNTQYVDVTPITATGYSLTGVYDYPEVNYINANALTLTFSSAVTGYTAIVGDSGNTDSYYLHNQGSASTTWTVNHNLGTQYVAVTAINDADRSDIGRYDYPNVTYNNANSLTLTWNSAETGKVAVVGGNIEGYYLHTQSSANTVWTIAHNLNTQYLSVTPIDSAGNSYVGRYDYPEVFYNNSNVLTLTFNSAVTGYVTVIGNGGTDLPAAGANTYVQYNDEGVLSGSPDFVFDKITGNVNVNGNVIGDNFYYSNGTPVSSASYSNVEVAAYLPTFNGTVGAGSATFYGANLTTGSSGTAGTITGNWTLTSGSRLTATYADLAEYYAGDTDYPAGTVLDFGGEKEVTIAGIESNKVAGVVSASPAYVMNGMINCDHPITIALQGRVPCKVKGKVRKGDMMISAGGGYAKAAIAAPSIGTVIGKALSNFDGEEGVIEVVVGRL